jgi:phosphatidylinositol glycan class N
LLFQPYAPLAEHDSIVSNIERLIGIGEFGSAQSASVELLDDCIAGLRYYQTYDWLFLRSVVSAGYAGWIAYSLIFIAREYSNVAISVKKESGSGDFIVNGCAGVMCVGFAMLLGYKEAPWMYYAYIAFPVYFWWYVLSQRGFLYEVFSSIGRDPQWMSGVCYCLAYVASLEVLVASYFWREILTPSLLVIAVCWPFVGMPWGFVNRNWMLVGAWVGFAGCTSVFTLLPVDKNEDQMLVYVFFDYLYSIGIWVVFLLECLVSSPYITSRG